jgi:hypothetical protein
MIDVLLRQYKIIFKLFFENRTEDRQVVCELPCCLLKVHLYRKNTKCFWVKKNCDSTETISKV